MNTPGQPYLRALDEHRPGPWVSMWRHTPLFFAGMLVVWGAALLLVLPHRQSLDLPSSWVPGTVCAVAAVLLVYAGCLLLVWPRADASETNAELPLPHRILRLVPATLFLYLLLVLLRAGLLLVLLFGPAHTQPEPLSDLVQPLAELAAGLALFALVGTLLVWVPSSVLAVLLGWVLWFLAQAFLRAWLGGADDVLSTARGSLLDAGWYGQLLAPGLPALL